MLRNKDDSAEPRISAPANSTPNKKQKTEVQEVAKQVVPQSANQSAPKTSSIAVPPMRQQGFFMKAEVNVEDFAAIRAYTDQHGFGAKKSPLRRGLTAQQFRDHYYDKNELMEFCREIGISTSGLKEDLNQRVELFFRTGTVTRTAPAARNNGTPDSVLGLRLDRVVRNYKSDPTTRAFFDKHIGDFTGFKAKILKWIKEQQEANVDFTYADIIQAYKDLSAGKKDGNHKVAYESCEMNQFYSDYSADAAKKPHKVADAWVLVRDAAGPKTYAGYRSKISEIAAMLKNPQPVANIKQ